MTSLDTISIFCITSRSVTLGNAPGGGIKTLNFNISERKVQKKIGKGEGGQC